MIKRIVCGLCLAGLLVLAAAVASEEPARCPHCGHLLPPGWGPVTHALSPTHPEQPEPESTPLDQPPTGHLDTPGAGTAPVSEPAGGLGQTFDIFGVQVPVVALALLCIAAAGSLALYFIVIVPWRKRRSLYGAFRIIAEDRVGEFPDAEIQLSRALTIGLKRKDIAEARFALAYVRARLGRFAEASTVVADLKQSDNYGRETIYLDVWLEARQKHDDRVEAMHTEHGDLLGDLLDTRLIAGISLLRLGKLRWSRREVDGALHYFARLRQLAVLTEEIPQHVDDHRIVFGLLALFEKDYETAGKHFTGALEAAETEDMPTYTAQLCQLLCRWSDGREADLDRDLQDQIRVIDEIRRNNPTPATDRDATLEEDDRYLDDLTLLLRGALLWSAVVLLTSWLNHPARGGLKAADRAELGRRLTRVRETDPDMADPDLIEGLIDYYFSFDDPERRQAALERLERAAESAVNLPEVLTLIDREKKLAELQHEGLTRFLGVVKDWVRNPGVPAHLREELKVRLQRHQRFRELGEMDVVAGDPDLAPSVADMQTRAQVLHKRIDQLVRPRLGQWDQADAENVTQLMATLNKSIDIMSQQARTAEQTEQSLMITTGEFLLKDEGEELDEAAPSPPAPGPRAKQRRGGAQP